MKIVGVVFIAATVLLIGYLCLGNNQARNLKMRGSVTQPKTVTIATQTYTLAEVATHSTGTNCWMAINGNVYDVSKFTNKHPSGTDFLKGCGADASSLYNSVRKHMGVTQILNSFKIGTLVNQ